MRDLGEQAEIAGVKVTILEYWIDSVTFGASLVAQLVKNPPAMLETLVQSLGQEDPLENLWRRERLPTPVFLPGESPRTEESGKLQAMGL